MAYSSKTNCDSYGSREILSDSTFALNSLDYLKTSYSMSYYTDWGSFDNSLIILLIYSSVSINAGASIS